MKKEVKLGTLFSGIGAPEFALKKIGIKPKLEFACEIDDYARKSFMANHNIKEQNFHKDIYSIDTKTLPQDLDLLVAGFPCFTAGHKVKTTNGYKKIEEIKTGDEVLTHTNTYQSVVVPMIKYTNELYNLKFYGSKMQEVTSEHPYYVLERTKKWDNDIKKYVYSFSEPKWKEAQFLRQNVDFVGINVNTQSKPIEFDINTIKKNYPNVHTFKYTTLPFEKEEFYWFLGRYMADGWYQDDKRINRENSNVNKVFLCCSHNETSFVEQQLKKLNLNYTTTTTTTEKTTTKFIFSNLLLLEFVKKFGKYAHNKYVPSEIENLPIKYLKPFLEGYLSGDGYFDEKNNKYRISTVSEDLALGVQNIVHKVYKTPCRIQFCKTSDTTVIEGRTVTQRDFYEISWKTKESNTLGFFKDNYMWFPLKKVSIINVEDTPVYNFEVANDNSYTIGNLIVHNCQAFSTAGKRMGVNDSCPNTGRNRGILYLEMMRIITDIKPKAILLENVRGITFKQHKPLMDDLHKQLGDLGYFFEQKIINTKEVTGVPQSRSRWFLVGFLKDSDAISNFEFPSEDAELKDIKELLVPNEEVPEKTYHRPYRFLKDFYTNLDDGSDGSVAAFTASREYKGFNNYCPTLCAQEFKSPKSVKTDTLANIKQGISDSGFDYEGFAQWMEKNVLDGRQIKEMKQVDFDKGEEVAINQFGLDYPKIRHYYRKLTPVESLRLQGFPADFLDKVKYNTEGQIVSNTQLYKQSGNSMTVDIMAKLIENILKSYD